MSAYITLVKRDLLITKRQSSSVLRAMLFLTSIIALMPFAIGPDLKTLQAFGPALLWISFLLAILLNLPTLLEADHEDGMIDIIRLSTMSMPIFILARLSAFWISHCLPLLFITPLIALFLNMQPEQILITIFTLFIGSIAISSLGMIGAALALCIERGSLLMVSMIIPLTMPFMIFGITASNAPSLYEPSFITPFLLLCALSLSTIILSPLAASALIAYMDE